MGETWSNSQVDNAGRRLRRWFQLDELLDPGPDLAILSAWRAQFETPMQATAVGLRSAVRTCVPGQPLLVKRRFKREVQILRKLHMRPSMRLSQMEDVAGCRAVLQSIDQVRAVQAQLGRAYKMEIRGCDDYIAAPQSTGYRAVHLHGVRDGFRVEIQLRTVRQHRWAEQVEEWDEAFHFDLKHGRGPAAVLAYFQLRGRVDALLDRGQHVPSQLERDLGSLRDSIIVSISEGDFGE